MQFGISTHLYHGARLERDHLVEIAAHGFEAVEIFATRTHFDYHDERAVAAIGEHLADTRLRPHSVHAPTSEGFTSGVWGPAYSLAHGGRSQQASRCRRDAGGHDSGASTRRGPRGPAPRHSDRPGPEPRDNRRDAFVASVEELQQAAQPLGVRLALEVIPNPIGDVETLVSLLEDELEIDGLGICLDTGHARMLGDVTEAVETASGYLVTTHLHDNDGRRDDHRVPFDGAINWPSVMMSFRKIGYDGTWMFELAGDRPRDVLEKAARARRKFEGLLTS